jgi:hypothetical protein
MISRPRYNSRKKRYAKKTNKSRFKQGYYTPKNPQKYIKPIDETMNSGSEPFYRSSWELKMYQYVDTNPEIKSWSTEYVAIPYYDPVQNKNRRYYPDIFVQFQDGRKLIIEIKPRSQYNNLTNQAKWEAAKLYAKSINAEFIVMNEKDLGIK